MRGRSIIPHPTPGQRVPPILAAMLPRSSLTTDELRQHMAGTYFTLRSGMGVLAIALPLLLAAFGPLADGEPLRCLAGALAIGIALVPTTGRCDGSGGGSSRSSPPATPTPARWWSTPPRGWKAAACPRACCGRPMPSGPSPPMNPRTS